MTDRRRRPRFGLRTRLFTASALLFVAITITLTVLGSSIDELSDASRRGTATSRSISGANALEKQLVNIETGARGYIITNDETYLEPWTFGRSEVERIAPLWLERVAAENADPALAKQIIARIDDYVDEYSVPLVEMVRDGATMQELRNELPKGKVRVDEIRELFTEFTTPRIARIGPEDEEARQAAEDSKRLATGLWLALATGLILTSIYLARTIVRPIARVREGVEAVGAGALDVHIDGGTLPETADLAAAFNRMVEELAAAQVELDARQREVEVHAEALARSNADLEQFAYVAAHDLQEPLRTVASYTELIARRYRGQLDSDADEFIEFAVNGAHRMQVLIQDLLAYSRLNTRAKEPVLVRLDDVVTAVEQSLATAIEEAGATIVHDGLPEVMGDPSQLELLLQNLIGNAVKFRSDEPPVVRVAGAESSEPGMVEVRIIDNGIGISEEYRERVFRMFQRLNHRSKYDGTGIGLALCKRIVERHGGSIRIDDTEGAGTTFVCTLPRTADRITP